MGIVFHTTYSGDTIENLEASFGANVSGLKKTKKVWYQDADYRDVSGQATMTAKQERNIQNYIKGTERIIKGSKAALKKIVNSPLKDLIKIYLNQNVRAGIDRGTATGLAAFLGSRFDTRFHLSKQTRQEGVQQEKDDLMKELKRNESLDGIFTAHYYLAQAKMLILKPSTKYYAVVH